MSTKPPLLNMSSLITHPIDPLYEHYNDNSDDFAENVYVELWMAQTFTPSITHQIQTVCLKCYRLGVTPYTAELGIRATDGAGKPTGPDLTATTFSTHLFKKDPPAEWQCIDLPPLTLNAGTMYAIVLRNPNPTIADVLVWRLTTAGTYAGGTSVRSTDGGVTWTILNPNFDFQFEEYGQLPVPPPAYPTRWALTSHTAICLSNGYEFVVITNRPVHLWLRFTTKELGKHPRSHIRRGLSVEDDVYYCFVHYEDNEQWQMGDTFTHTFTKRGWPLQQIRYFYYLGTLGGIPCPSTSCVFQYHFPPLPIRNQLVTTPIAMERAYTTHAKFNVFVPPKTYTCNKLSAILSKEDALHTGTFPAHIYLELRHSPAHDPCGTLITKVAVNTIFVPERPNFTWVTIPTPPIELLYLQAYAFIVRSDSDEGATNWGLCACTFTDECIMSPENGHSFHLGNPCPLADEYLCANFVCAPEHHKDPVGDYTWPF